MLHVGHLPWLPSLSLDPPSYSPTLDKVTFPSQGRVFLFRVETWASVPFCLFKKTKPIKIRTSKWLINIPRCAVNRGGYLRDVFHLLLAKPIKILIKNNLLFNIRPFIFPVHTKGNPIKECNLLHIMLTFTRIEIKSCQVIVQNWRSWDGGTALGQGGKRSKVRLFQVFSSVWQRCVYSADAYSSRV